MLYLKLSNINNVAYLIILIIFVNRLGCTHCCSHSIRVQETSLNLLFSNLFSALATFLVLVLELKCPLFLVYTT